MEVNSPVPGRSSERDQGLKSARVRNSPVRCDISCPSAGESALHPIQDCLGLLGVLSNCLSNHYAIGSKSINKDCSDAVNASGVQNNTRGSALSFVICLVLWLGGCIADKYRKIQPSIIIFMFGNGSASSGGILQIFHIHPSADLASMPMDRDIC